MLTVPPQLDEQACRSSDEEAALDHPWLPSALRALREASATCPLSSAIVPLNASAERRRLTGTEASPAWNYARYDADGRGEALRALARFLAGERGCPVSRLLAARAHELAEYTEMAESVGTRRFSHLSQRGNAPSAAAIALANEWCKLQVPPAHEPSVASEGPGVSLESALRSRLAELAVDWPVTARAGMAALAATGDGFVAVAVGRRLTEATLRRTVVHEIEGHVLPRVRANRVGHALTRIGSAQGIAAQEGWALRCEERAGLLTAPRKHELAWRTLACARMADGASFVDVLRALQREAAFTHEAAYALAERLFRGSLGTLPGLGRESHYLNYYIRIRDHLAEHAGDEALFACAVVAPEWCADLRKAMGTGGVLR